MKRLVLVIMLFLTACGSGGGGGATAGGNGWATTSNTSVGTLVVNIQSGDTTVPAGMVAAAAPPQSTYVRVVVSNANLKSNNQTFKQIADIPVGSTYTFSAIPASIGYNVEAVSYVMDGSLNRMIKYAKNSVNVTANVTNSVTLAMAPIQVTLNVPLALSAGASYSVSTLFPSQSTPLRSAWALVTQTSDFVAPIHQTYSLAQAFNLYAPTPFSSGMLYFQAEYFINSTLLNSNENYLNWTFNYPNPWWGDTSISVPLTVPSGDIVITVPPVI